jgi:hypothetical protein
MEGRILDVQASEAYPERNGPSATSASSPAPTARLRAWLGRQRGCESELREEPEENQSLEDERLDDQQLYQAGEEAGQREEDVEQVYRAHVGFDDDDRGL